METDALIICNGNGMDTESNNAVSFIFSCLSRNE